MTTLSALSAAQRDALLANPWFASLPPAIQEDLVRRGRLRPLEVDQCLFRRGEVADGLFIVLEGCIRVGGTSVDGYEALLNFYEPGSWIGEVAMLDGEPRLHEAHAHVRSLALQIVAADFEELLSTHPGFCRLMLRLTGQRLRQMLEAFEAFTTQSLEQRLAGRLVMLAAHYGTATPHGVRIELQLPQESLAQLVGATRQRINQVLKQWEAQGLVARERARLLLLDRDALVRLARR